MSSDGCRLSDALLGVQKSSEGLLDGSEVRQSICLIVRPIKLTLSLTTSTQAVLRAPIDTR